MLFAVVILGTDGQVSDDSYRLWKPIDSGHEVAAGAGVDEVTLVGVAVHRAAAVDNYVDGPVIVLSCLVRARKEGFDSSGL